MIPQPETSDPFQIAQDRTKTGSLMPVHINKRANPISEVGPIPHSSRVAKPLSFITIKSSKIPFPYINNNRIPPPSHTVTKKNLDIPHRILDILIKWLENSEVFVLQTPTSSRLPGCRGTRVVLMTSATLGG